MRAPYVIAWSVWLPSCREQSILVLDDHCCLLQPVLLNQNPFLQSHDPPIMKHDASTYRLITGIRTARPNPMVLKRGGTESEEPEEEPVVEQESVERGPLEPVLEAARPETTRVRFKAYQFDKDYAFHYIQRRWFQRQLELGEELIVTADHLKMICDEVHEMGRLRERNRKGCTCALEPR